MKLFNSAILFFILISITGKSKSQDITLFGRNYSERSESLINSMAHDIELKGGNLKYSSAFYFARIYKGYEKNNAIKEIEKMLDYQLEKPERYFTSGSDIEFFAHATIHGYLLTKDKMPEILRNKIKSFMQLGDYNSKGITLNLDMMRYTAGFLSSEEWPDFVDKNGKTAKEIIDYNRPRILDNLDNFFHNSCKEMDAFVYLPTNMMYVRMLAEYAKDNEVRQKAEIVYQQMIANMIGSWNDQGLYIANPPRSKGWSQLVTGPLGANSRTTALAWLFFGSNSNKMLMTKNYISDSNNYPTLCFWMAYKRNVAPKQSILDVAKNKTYPYEYRSMIDDITVGKEGNSQKNWKYYKYTYQSNNYGLATQTEIPYKFENAQYTYAYKEIKRTYLAWKSDDKECFFTICQDNPYRPKDYENANSPAYGENPYHRVMQYKQSAIGVFNVPEDYIAGKRYQLYVPFTNKGIKLRNESDGWIFCHTGNMMFAFRTIQPYIWKKGLYNIPNCDILMLSDLEARKGAWVLETAEITKDYKSISIEKELDKFKNSILKRTKLEYIEKDALHPQLKYTSLNGDVLDLVFFSPNEAYLDQYKVNDKVLPITDNYLYNSPYAKQLDKSDEFLIMLNGKKEIFKWVK